MQSLLMEWTWMCRTKRHFEKMVHTVGMEMDSFHKRLCPFRLTALRNYVPWSLMAQNVVGTRAFDERNASYIRLIFNFKISQFPSYGYRTNSNSFSSKWIPTHLMKMVWETQSKAYIFMNILGFVFFSIWRYWKFDDKTSWIYTWKT
jgi:hypothetical protein